MKFNFWTVSWLDLKRSDIDYSTYHNNLWGELFEEKLWPPPGVKASSRRPLSTPPGANAPALGREGGSAHKSKVNVSVF
jgi:hypothetical protein